MALAFYHGQGSPYSWRVWLALEHLGIPYELKVLSFDNKDTAKPEFIAINPRHTVPTITDDDVALWESVVILEYLDERFGMDAPARLYPGTEAERARIRLLVREAEEYLGAEGTTPLTNEYLFMGDTPPDLEKVAKARAVVTDELAYFSGQLRGKFLAGDSPTAADFVLYPFLAFVYRITFRKPQAALTELVPTALVAWKKRVEALPFFDKTVPPHWR
jgi:glutathione S-transferase